MLVTVTSFGKAQAEKGHFFLWQLLWLYISIEGHCQSFWELRFARSLWQVHIYALGKGTNYKMQYLKHHQVWILKILEVWTQEPSGIWVSLCLPQGYSSPFSSSFASLGQTVLQSPVRSWKDDILETVCIANKAVKQAIENEKAVERKQRTDFAKFWKSVARGCSQQADGTRIVFDRVCIQWRDRTCLKDLQTLYDIGSASNASANNKLIDVHDWSMNFSMICMIQFQVRTDFLAWGACGGRVCEPAGDDIKCSPEILGSVLMSLWQDLWK